MSDRSIAEEIFHADSLFDARLYDEARQAYDLAFSEDRYILPSRIIPAMPSEMNSLPNVHS